MHHTLPHAGASIAFSLPTSLISIASPPWPLKRFRRGRTAAVEVPAPPPDPSPNSSPTAARAHRSRRARPGHWSKGGRADLLWHPEIAGMCQAINAQTGLDDHIITGRGLAPACPIRHLLSHIWSLASVDGREVI